MPKFVVRAALQLPSPDGRTYSDRIDAAKTDCELSEIHEDFIAVAPNIALESPKITRKLTTDWFARRVDERYRRCLAKSAGTAAA